MIEKKVEDKNLHYVNTSARTYLLPRISPEGVVIIAVFFAIAFFLML